MGQRLARGLIAECAKFALKGDTLGFGDQAAHHKFRFNYFAPISLRALARSSGVSTESVTESTRATAMRIPASSARSSSSFARFSSGDGGSFTKRANASRV